jgi:glycine dehydrogenase subunit 2
VPAVDAEKLLADLTRDDLGQMPEVSEIEIIRHFTRISTWNYAVDHGMYPLGSCTMKYNARVNETVARLTGLAEAHPYQPEKISQGALRIIKMLSDQLIEITGMDAITLQPAAGAHGEMTGILLVRAYLESQGNPRKKILVPGSATGPTTPLRCAYAVENEVERGDGRISRRLKRPRGRRGADAHQPQHAGRVRAGDPQNRRPATCQRRSHVHGRRQHECAGRKGAAGRLRR